jgi:hypothetical protein
VEEKEMTDPQLLRIMDERDRACAETAVLREALEEIAGSTLWGEGTAIKREITRLQGVAKEALLQLGPDTTKWLNRLHAAEAVADAADSHYHYRSCSSNIGCHCETKDIEGPVLAYRAARGIT